MLGKALLSIIVHRKMVLNQRHFKLNAFQTQCLKKAHDLIRLKRTTVDKNRTQERPVVHFNIKSFRKRDRVGLPRPGFRLAPPPLISSAHSGEAFVQHLWVWSRQKPSQIHLSLFSRCQRRSKSRARRSF